jgi:hypothetical protein
LERFFLVVLLREVDEDTVAVEDEEVEDEEAEE